MVEIFERETETIVGQNINEDTVQYYCKHTHNLAKTQVSKAKKFLKWDCIKYIGVDAEFGSKYCFVCLPLNKQEFWDVNGRRFVKKPYPKDYNFSEYKIFLNKDGVWECNCQYWQTKKRKGEISDGVNCSHTLALMFAFKLRRFKQEAIPL